MQAYIFKATCTNVVDGDTIDCVLDLGFSLKATHRLRLHGINTDEMHDNRIDERMRAEKAKQFVIEQVLGKDVMVQTYKSDVFGRYLAKVFIPLTNGVYHCLNELLIEEGLAKPYKDDTSLL